MLNVSRRSEILSLLTLSAMLAGYGVAAQAGDFSSSIQCARVLRGLTAEAPVVSDSGILALKDERGGQGAWFLYTDQGAFHYRLRVTNAALADRSAGDARIASQPKISPYYGKYRVELPGKAPLYLLFQGPAAGAAERTPAGIARTAVRRPITHTSDGGYRAYDPRSTSERIMTLLAARAAVGSPTDGAISYPERVTPMTADGAGNGLYSRVYEDGGIATLGANEQLRPEARDALLEGLRGALTRAVASFAQDPTCSDLAESGAGCLDRHRQALEACGRVAGLESVARQHLAQLDRRPVARAPAVAPISASTSSR